jgi:Ca2+-binding EF-hand superfamily protein
MQALDRNGDGVIDETEIAQASANLKKLDKNGDGKITREELRPVLPEGQRRGGAGGPEGDRPNRPRPPGDNPPPQK